MENNSNIKVLKSKGGCLHPEISNGHLISYSQQPADLEINVK